MEVYKLLLSLLGRALFAADFTFDPKSVPWADLFAESWAYQKRMGTLLAGPMRISSKSK